MSGRHAPTISLRETRERLVASVRARSHPRELRQIIASAQDEVLDVIGAEGLAPAGPMFTRYHRLGPIAEVEVGVPLMQTVRPHPRVMNSTLPAGSAVHATCIGSRAKLVQTVNALHEHVQAAGLKAAGGYWEYYLTEPIPGLDLCQVEYYLPVVGAPTNGRHPPRPTEPVAIPVHVDSATPIPIRTEASHKSVFARRGPVWEEGAGETEPAAPTRSRSTNGVSLADHEPASGDTDASVPEA